ncbi:unnamed protein product [Timema podura]|uniref:Uncharacterized protein n=1 Tax=Timema podura TaxID=61482 RepID=A0ABN7PDQ7_TIMPD|nr:unnamed protein product [Timema podura]
MIRALLVTLLVASSYGAPLNDSISEILDGRIVGGRTISIEQAPYQASYLTKWKPWLWCCHHFPLLGFDSRSLQY